jgi:hypothetical protein
MQLNARVFVQLNACYKRQLNAKILYSFTAFPLWGNASSILTCYSSPSRRVYDFVSLEMTSSKLNLAEALSQHFKATLLTPKNYLILSD